MKQKLINIYDRVNKACDFAGRDAKEITLIAVTKNRSNDDIKRLLDAGITHFGENRVPEALEKWPSFNSDDVTLHMIGPLQSNKVRLAKDIFDVLHTLDRPSLLKEMIKYQWQPPTFVQVNTGEEAQKSGLKPNDLQSFVETVPWPIQGLMCIPPHDAPASLHFALLKSLGDRQAHRLTQFSMGMSMDFEQAIKCGATHIRLGRILFDDL